MLFFWVTVSALALLVTALLGLVLLRGRRATGPSEAYDLKVYRDQLTEIQRDVARGTLDASEADRLKVEISRRLLAADAKVQQGVAGRRQPSYISAVMGGAVALFLCGGAYLLYTQLGAPGYADQPLAGRIALAAEVARTRPSQAEAAAVAERPEPPAQSEEYLDLVAQLRAALAERPADLRGLQLLFRSETALGNYTAAWQALDRIIAIKGAQASANDFAILADTMAIAAGGYVSPEAEKAVNAALQRDPSNGIARYYRGLMLGQVGRPDLAFRIWDTLLRETPPDAPWRQVLLDQIEEMAFRAGVASYQIPTARGPSAADVAAAQELSPQDRRAMIEAMVTGLAERLASEGGPPQEWARLIMALGVLERTTEAQAIWQEAQAVFANAPQALDLLAQSAANAGLSE